MAQRLESVRPNRIPPHNLDAEQSVLGAMLESKDAIANVIEILEAAESLLRERPAHEVTVMAVMERTTLSRKARSVLEKQMSVIWPFLARRRRRSSRLAAGSRPLIACANSSTMAALSTFLANALVTDNWSGRLSLPSRPCRPVLTRPEMAALRPIGVSGRHV